MNRKEFRPLKVGSIKDKYLRRLCLILWHVPLMVISVLVNIVRFSVGLIYVSFKDICYINKDFVKCWKSPKQSPNESNKED